jgi:hypothetical protein
MKTEPIVRSPRASSSPEDGVPASAENVQVFVVMGAAKSGTTWLQQALDSHPQVRCHFQRLILPMRLPPRKTGSTLFDVGDSAFGGIFASDEQERRYDAEFKYLYQSDFLRGIDVAPLTATLAADEAGWVESLHDGMLRSAVQALLVDVPGKAAYGTKAYTDLGRFFKLFPEGKVVHITRDGRDVVVSHRFHMARRGAYYVGDERFRLHRLVNRFGPSRKAAVRLLSRIPAKWKGKARALFLQPGKTGPLLTPATIEKFAGDWKAAVEYVRGAAKTHEANVLTVRYEDMLADLPSQLTAVFSFLGVDSDPDTVDGVVQASSRERERLSQVPEGFLRKGGAGDWRTVFEPDSIRLFNEVAGETLVALGYENDLAWGNSVG